MQPRRADFVWWTLSDLGALKTSEVRKPIRAGYDLLSRVHHADWLQSLSNPETLARIFAIETWDVDVDALMSTIRLAVGGTVAAAADAVRRKGPSFNLLGGFHHAKPDGGGGFCALNDVAVAVASLRADGWRGSVAVVDLDAHPPDGTAACLPDAWIGSISVADWGGSAGVHEEVLPRGVGGARWLDAVARLIEELPEADLTFVLAGADVLTGDPLGDLGVSIPEAALAHRRVAVALRGRSAVWLPAGGYLPSAWMVFANAWLAVHLPGETVPEDVDPLSSHFASIYPSLSERDLEFDLDDLGPGRARRLLGYYSAEALEQGLEAYGILPHLRRLGYGPFRIAFERSESGERFVLRGDAKGPPEAFEVLAEAVLDRTTIQGKPVLFVNWLSLRHPRARFLASRPPLPGQEVPGLGMAREAAELLRFMARRLQLAGVALRPAWFHVAWSARSRFRFVDPAIEADFRALIRDLGHLPLRELTEHVAAGRVCRDGQPWRWVPGDMVQWLDDPEPADTAPTEATFSLAGPEM